MYIRQSPKTPAFLGIWASLWLWSTFLYQAHPVGFTDDGNNVIGQGLPLYKWERPYSPWRDNAGCWKPYQGILLHRLILTSKGLFCAL